MLPMRQSYRIIPIYTADVSGVCSALYELGGMTVMHDPSGCNSTYNTHDEIRWYDQDSLITLDMLYVRATPKVQTIFWMINKIFSLGLGIIMIVAYQGMYKINSTSYFSTMQFVSKAWDFLPMAIAGGFIVVKTAYQLMDRIVVPHGTNTN